MPVLRHLHPALLLLLRAEMTLRVHVGVKGLILTPAPTRRVSKEAANEDGGDDGGDDDGQIGVHLDMGRRRRRRRNRRARTRGNHGVVALAVPHVHVVRRAGDGPLCSLEVELGSTGDGIVLAVDGPLVVRQVRVRARVRRRGLTVDADAERLERARWQVRSIGRGAPRRRAVEQRGAQGRLRPGGLAVVPASGAVPRIQCRTIRTRPAPRTMGRASRRPSIR